jgi:hypothetical protein
VEQLKQKEIQLRSQRNRMLVWIIVVAATVVLNAAFHTLVRLEGCTPGVGYGIPMGGGECQPFTESYFGLIGFLGGVWFFLIGWPGANLLLGLYFAKRYGMSKLLTFPVIFVLAFGTFAVLGHLYPSFAPD